MKFQVGDQVCVRPYREIAAQFKPGSRRIDDVYFNESMQEYCGHVFTVAEVLFEREGKQCYHLKDDSGYLLRSDGNVVGWVFSESMLCPAAPHPQAGDYVTIKPWAEIVALSDQAGQNPDTLSECHFGTFWFTPTMKSMCGGTYRILNVSTTSRGLRYEINDDAGFPDITWYFMKQHFVKNGGVPSTAPTISFQQLFESR